MYALRFEGVWGVLPGCEHDNEVIVHSKPSGRWSIKKHSCDFLITQAVSLLTTHRDDPNDEALT